MKINPNDTTSLYLQIAESLKDDILRNVLLEEEQAPSSNEIAKRFQLNPATAAKGLNLLVDEGILYKKRGIGMFVAPKSREKIIDIRKAKFFEDYVQNMVTEAKKLSISTDELIAMIRNANNHS